MNALTEEEDTENEDIKEMIRALKSLPDHNKSRKKELQSMEKKAKPLASESQKLELKQLPSHLWYAYLKNYLVIVNASLNTEEEEKLLTVLRKYKDAIRWTITDIKRISPSICTHIILMVESYKLVVQLHR